MDHPADTHHTPPPTRPPGPDQSTTTTPPAPARRPSTPRHLRIPDGPWRAAATRARQEGYGVAELAALLVAAYGAGVIDAPSPPASATPHTPHPDAWSCLACRAEEVRTGLPWLDAPCTAHPPTTTSKDRP